ncbi:MAG: sialidase, partial [Candidatus Brocadiia bacterium]
MRARRTRNALIVFAALIVVAGLAWQAPAFGYTDLTGDYTWKPLKIGGGGWVVGMWVHPNASGVAYCRSDVGGAYRWDETNDVWINCVTADSVPEPADGYYGSTYPGTNYSGVDSIVGAPSDANVAYMAYTGNVYRSSDGTVTWALPGTLGVTMEPNGEARQCGERLAVDPADANVVYYGSVRDGLWVSTDGAATWSQVSAIPVGTAEHGVSTVVFDPTSGTTGGKTNVIYASVYGSGVYQSTDAGASWSQILSTGDARDAEVGPDGTYYIADQNAQSIKKYSGGSWTDISPGSQNWQDIAVDPFDGQRLFTTKSGGGDFWRSTDQGASWTQLSRSTYSDITWQHDYYYGSSWMSIGEMIFDPTVQDQMWLAEGFGMWRTTDVNDSDITWTSVSRGIEDLCPEDVVCPSTLEPVGCGMDLNAWYWTDFDSYTTEHAWNVFSHGWSLDWCASTPSFVALLSDGHGNERSGYSSDGGLTWTQFSQTPGQGADYPRALAVSATDTNNLIWYDPTTNKVSNTTNCGGSWSPGTSLGTPHNQWWGPGDGAVAADKVDGGTFYVYNWAGDADGGIWRSTDGGSAWSHVSSDVPAARFPLSMETTPGYAGHVWLCGNADGYGLYRSTDYGVSWTLVSGTDWGQAVGFGKAADGASYPTIYYAGELNGEAGIWRSTDETATWSKICEYPLGIFSEATGIDGDPDVFGKLYVGLDSKGFAYGEQTGGDTTPPS